MSSNTPTTLNAYINAYPIRLQDHLAKYEDYDELHFIESELWHYQHCFDSANVTYQNYMGVDEDGFRSPNIYAYELEKPYDGFVPNDEILGMVEDIFCEDTNGYDIEIAERLKLSFVKIMEHLRNRKSTITLSATTSVGVESNQQRQQYSLIFQGSELEFTEFVKGQIQANMVNPELTQKEIFSRMRKMYNMPLFNENEKLADIRKRTRDLTPYTDKTQLGLTNWIKKKD